ncbi:hypothetical protein H6F95_08965 [Cyanobacteria bacterium FACHB-471]|nr:hypothetical protein [Cyanobacteria bacterium FACHB-471]
MHTIPADSVGYPRPSRVYAAVRHTYGKTNIHFCHTYPKSQKAIVLNCCLHYLRYRVIKILSLREKHTLVKAAPV